MKICTWTCLITLGAISAFKANNDLLLGLTKDKFQDGSSSRILQHFEVNRHKRNAPSGGSGGQCCQNGGDGRAEGSNRVKHVVVHHYHHHYHYCCPCIPEQLHPQNIPSPPTCGAPHHKSNVTVSCDCDSTAGSISCSVGANTNSDAKQQPRTQNPTGVFGVSMMIDDPIGKDFSDFISKNFVERDNPGEPKVCQNKNTATDAVCKEFFDFLSKNFERKMQNPTPVPVQSHAPTQAQTQSSNDKEIQDIKNKFEQMFNRIVERAS